MNKNTLGREILDKMEVELSFLYSIGVDINDIDYLLDMKIRQAEREPDYNY